MWVEGNIGTTDIFCRNVMVLAILFDNYNGKRRFEPWMGNIGRCQLVELQGSWRYVVGNMGSFYMPIIHRKLYFKFEVFYVMRD